MSNKYLLLICVFIICLFVTCDKLETEEGQYPIVITGIVDDIEDTKITLCGNIVSLGGDAPIDYGFVWGTGKLPTIDDYNKRFGETPQKGIFSAEIDYDLFADSLFYVRTFIETDNHIIYGESQAFVSNGCNSPEMLKISPTETIGTDTISIYGNHFTSKLSDISISYFVDAISYSWGKAKVISTTSDTIKFILSSTPLKYSANVFLSVKLRGNEINTEGTETPVLKLVNGSEIVDIYPRITSPRGSIKLYANNMIGSPYSITFRSTNSDTKKTTSKIEMVGDSIHVKLPGLDFGSYRMMLHCKYQDSFYYSISQDSITIKKPEIISIPDNIMAGDTVLFKVRYLDLYASSIALSTGESISSGQYLHTERIDSNNIKVFFPSNIYENRYNLFVAYDDVKTTVNVQSCWQKKNVSVTTGTYYLSHLYNNKIIWGMGTNIYGYIDNIWEYNIDNNTVKEITTSPVEYYNPISFIQNDKLYIAGGVKISSYSYVFAPESYSFDLNQKAWGQTQDFNGPGSSRYSDHVSTCQFNAKIYFKRRSNTAIYSYDSEADTWSYVNDFPEKAIDDNDKTILLANNSSLYIVFLDYTMYSLTEIKIYKLDTSDNTWNKNAEISIDDYFYNALIENNQIWLVASDSIYQYSTDGMLVNTYLNKIITSSNVSHFYNGKLYGISGDQIIEFDPNKY